MIQGPITSDMVMLTFLLETELQKGTFCNLYP